MTAVGRALARLRRQHVPDGDGLVREVSGSEDGARAFVDRGQVSWTGR